jgi:hypothetical protein
MSSDESKPSDSESPKFPPLTVLNGTPGKPVSGGGGPVFPSLPIITPDAPRMSQSEKYGGLFYLGIAGLFVVIGLVSWFGWNVWSLRNVWNNVYVLHDSTKGEEERIAAGYALSKDMQVNAQERWDIALRKPLPALARYLLAESWPIDLVSADPEMFAKVVTKSEGWPDWLRLMGARLMAVAAADGTNFDPLVLTALAESKNFNVQVFVDYIRAVATDSDKAAIERLKALASGTTSQAELAKELVAAIEVGSAERAKQLEKATVWLRANDPDLKEIWKGWTEREGTLVQTKP